MESKNVKVKLGEGVCFELSPSTMNVKEIVRSITENKDNINPDFIEVTCEEEDFDVEGFKMLLKDVTEEYIEEIKINDELLAANKNYLNGMKKIK